jgi:uncharacterized protein
MKLALSGIAIGLAAGLLGALCGVGGGIFMVPAFTRLLGLSQKQAVATSLAVIILTSLASTVSNVVRGSTPLIQWPLFTACAAGGIVASVFGSELMRKLSDDTLTRLFAVVLIAAGLWMWFSAAPSSKPASQASASHQKE